MQDYSLDTCDYCQAETWCEQRANGRPQCRGCRVVNFFRNFLYKPIGYDLLKWQEDFLRRTYGTVRPADGRRRFTRVYGCIAKKNGKSFLTGGLPIYHLVAEDEWKPEAYGAASSKKQAGIVFTAAASLIEANPELKKILKILPSTKRIVRRDGRGFYEVLSGDGNFSDGIEPSLTLIDELHRWKTERAMTLYQVLTKGAISRPERLTVEITTAGAEDESILWNREHELAKDVLSGAIHSETFLPIVYSADPERINSEPDYWMSREARVAANPSHVDNGGFLPDDAIVEELEKAIKDPAEKNNYLRYHLNVKVTSVQENAIDIPQWMNSTAAGDVDLRNWPVYDVELLIRKWGLAEKPCVLGIDAGWKIDLSSLAALFPPESKGGVWKLLVWHFMPAGRVRERERRDQVAYTDWVKRGFVETCPGNANDNDLVRQKILWAREMFDVQHVCYDPWGFRETAMTLQNKDNVSEMVEVKPTYGNLSEATKDFLAAYLDGKLWHGNNPALNFNAACLALEYDKKDNVIPAKPERMKTKKRIDGISATVTAWSRAMLLEETVDIDAFLRNAVGV